MYSITFEIGKLKSMPAREAASSRGKYKHAIV